MITNREEVLENALRVFARMNYEKASLMEIARACGLSKAGIIYYFPCKLDLFVAVVDKYVFGMQTAANKFMFSYTSLEEFINRYAESVRQTMENLVTVLDGGTNPTDCSPNFYYYHLIMQVRLYYPDVKSRIAAVFEQDYKLWRKAVKTAQENGEIRCDIKVDDAAEMFRQVFLGMSFEQSFFSGLDVGLLIQKLKFVYMLMKG